MVLVRRMANDQDDMALRGKFYRCRACDRKVVKDARRCDCGATLNVGGFGKEMDCA